MNCLENVITVYEKTLDEIKIDATYFCPIMKENFILIKENDEQSETRKSCYFINN